MKYAESLLESLPQRIHEPYECEKDARYVRNRIVELGNVGKMGVILLTPIRSGRNGSPEARTRRVFHFFSGVFSRCSNHLDHNNKWAARKNRFQGTHENLD